MTNNNMIIIPQSKTKLFLLLLGAIAFVVFGCWFLISPETFKDTPFGNPLLLRLIGSAAIVFFGFCGVYAAKKLGDTTPGIIIDEHGITDNCSAVSAGLIAWNDITDIKRLQMASQTFLIVEVINPETYISAQQGFIKKKLMEVNHKSYGSPISLTANGLKCTAEELNKMVEEGYQKFKRA